MDYNVYIITCMENLKRYIGLGKIKSDRLSNHRNQLRNGKHSNRHIARDVKKYGYDAFNFRTVATGDERLCRDLENNLIVALDTMDNRYGYNHMCYGRWSDEARQRNTEVKLRKKGKFMLLKHIGLYDPMDPIYLASCMKTKP